MAGPLARIPPHLVHRDFLPPEEQAALLDWAMANAAVFSQAKIGPRGHVDPTRRNALNVDAETQHPWCKPLRTRLIAMLPEWLAAFGLAPFTVSKIELDLIAYNDGAFYQRHSDIAGQSGPGAVPQPNGDRLITAVYYFHSEPKGFSGGALRLYPIARSRPGEPERFVDIEPEQNSLAVFPSWAPHEVLPVSCPSGVFADSRFAVNCWIRRAR